MLRGNNEFIVRTTSKTPQEVKDFYTKERMQAVGWNPDTSAGCEGDAGTSGMENMCFFGKKERSKDGGLAIIIVQDVKTMQTQLFYGRVCSQETPVKATAPATPAD